MTPTLTLTPPPPDPARREQALMVDAAGAMERSAHDKRLAETYNLPPKQKGASDERL